MRDMAERKAETKRLSPESVPNNINKYLYNVVNVGTYSTHVSKFIQCVLGVHPKVKHNLCMATQAY